MARGEVVVGGGFTEVAGLLPPVGISLIEMRSDGVAFNRGVMRLGLYF